MLETVNIFRIDPSNVGDFYSSPIHYFDWLSSIRAFDIEATDFDRYANQLKEANIILGGGGILKFDQIDKLSDAYPQALIAWGLGHNQEDTEQLIPDLRLKKFSLVGVRDYGIGYSWVPCVSCLHPVFDNQPDQPIKEVVVYEHKKRPLYIEGLPKLTNREMQLDKVIAFLSSAATVVTNSYHGAYWATLLKRKVVVVDSWSTKFQAFKHPPVFAETYNWRDRINEATVYEEALSECREANLGFSEQVRNIIQP